MTHLGARLGRVETGVVDIDVEHDAGLTQQHGYFHGGLSATLADTACGYAALTLAPEGSEVLTVSLSVSFLAPAAGDRLQARAQVVRAGRTLTVCRAEAYALTTSTIGCTHSSTHSSTGGDVDGDRSSAGAARSAGGREVHVASVTATLMRIAASPRAPEPASESAPAEGVDAGSQR